MPAFTQSFNLLDLSISYDGVTIYPKFKEAEYKKSLWYWLNKKMTLSNTEESNNLYWMRSVLKFLHGFTPVKRESVDHDLYHQDNLSINNSHYHLKTNSWITRDLIKTLGKILVFFNLITKNDQEELLKSYDNYLLQHIDAIQLTNDRANDFPTIMSAIKTTTDNPLLINLHQHLSQSKYDYLRAYQGESIWVSRDSDEREIPTSYEWATIEKAISLQMAHNVTKKSFFVASERAVNMAVSHGFFAHKHKAGKSHQLSKSFKNFRDSDLEKFNESYKKNMNGF